MDGSLVVAGLSVVTAATAMIVHRCTRRHEKRRIRRSLALRLALLDARRRAHAEATEAHLFWALLHDPRATGRLFSAGELARCREHARELLSSPQRARLSPGREPALMIDPVLLLGKVHVANLLHDISRTPLFSSLVDDARRHPIAAPVTRVGDYRADEGNSESFAVRLWGEERTPFDLLVTLLEDVFALSTTEATFHALERDMLDHTTFGDFEERGAHRMVATAVERARAEHVSLQMSVERRQAGARRV